MCQGLRLQLPARGLGGFLLKVRVGAAVSATLMHIACGGASRGHPCQRLGGTLRRGHTLLVGVLLVEGGEGVAVTVTLTPQCCLWGCWKGSFFSKRRDRGKNYGSLI